MRTRDAYGVDGLKRGHPADVVVAAGNTAEVAAIARSATRRARRSCRAAPAPAIPAAPCPSAAAWS